jgi:hypothetical protein
LATSAGFPASIQAMTSVIAAPAAGGVPGADVRDVVGAFDVVETAVEDDGVGADEDGWLSGADEHPASRAATATSTAIRIPARLAGVPGTRCQARPARELFANV